VTFATEKKKKIVIADIINLHGYYLCNITEDNLTFTNTREIAYVIHPACVGEAFETLLEYYGSDLANYLEIVYSTKDERVSILFYPKTLQKVNKSLKKFRIFNKKSIFFIFEAKYCWHYRIS
jgi:hypothetical protein